MRYIVIFTYGWKDIRFDFGNDLMAAGRFIDTVNKKLIRDDKVTLSIDIDEEEVAIVKEGDDSDD